MCFLSVGLSDSLGWEWRREKRRNRYICIQPPVYIYYKFTFYSFHFCCLFIFISFLLMFFLCLSVVGRRNMRISLNKHFLCCFVDLSAVFIHCHFLSFGASILLLSFSNCWNRRFATNKWWLWVWRGGFSENGGMGDFSWFLVLDFISTHRRAIFK